jgi:hypothetical protein
MNAVVSPQPEVIRQVARAQHHGVCWGNPQGVTPVLFESRPDRGDRRWCKATHSTHTGERRAHLGIRNQVTGDARSILDGIPYLIKARFVNVQPDVSRSLLSG